MSRKPPSVKKSQTSVDHFLSELATRSSGGQAGANGRLLFAMDATASRQPSWDSAAQIQGEMFAAADDLGGLSVQLAFFRGFGEFKISQWTDRPAEMARLVASVSCLAGETQIIKVLKHALNETRKTRVDALVFVGDSMEEDVDALGQVAGELGLAGLPVFIFQEANDPIASFAFQQIAKLSGGACVQFDRASAETLRKLLGAIAVYAAGGRKALSNLAKSEGGAVLQISNQMARR
ncbi:MAG: VWA domain-containing protein [Rhodospirillales bacterium]|nr:VWA domain-containing protein [Rhodospirillales bacterium]